MKNTFAIDRARKTANYFLKSSALFSACFLFLAVPAKAWTLLEALGVKEEEDYVDISVAYDSNCPDDFPLTIKITNNYNETIENTRFSITGRRDGFSDELYDEGYSTDKIIEPAATYESCWRIPQRTFARHDVERDPLQELIWVAEIIYIITSD